MSRLFWRLVRILIRLRRGRAPPASLKGPVWYFAYSPNMNVWTNTR